jgi:Peptidase S26.
MGPEYNLPLTKEKAEAVKAMAFVQRIDIEEEQPDSTGFRVYPYSSDYPWSRDNYGPIWMPQKGATVKLNLQNIVLYERIITAYEGNTLECKNGTILLNGQATDQYTFKMDYYFMLGDNRHKSADSRYWGFVPEDHIVGKPILVWLSLDKDKSFPGNIRWNRFFKVVHNN